MVIVTREWVDNREVKAYCPNCEYDSLFLKYNGEDHIAYCYICDEELNLGK
jgi:hypothetical protein